MEPENILRSDSLDILFENRNKAYGAYALRRQYGNHLAGGLLGMFLIVASLWVMETLPGKGSPSLLLTPFEIPDPYILEPVPLKPEVPAKQQPVQARASTSLPPPMLVKQILETEFPDQDRLSEAIIATRNRDGLPDPGLPPQSNGLGDGLPAPFPPAAEETTAPYLKAELMPSFPGGDAALHQWLSRQLRSPEMEQEGQRVRVVVRFAVSKTGEIEQIALVQTGGQAFDQEVLRVIRKMPKWIPGRQGGKAVAVWFSIPVIFEMPEQ